MVLKRETNVFTQFVAVVLLAPVFLLIIPLLLAWLVCMLVYGAALTFIVWLLWGARGIDTLVVYSDSPHWRDYMTDSVIPRLQGRAIILNWSERRHWRTLSLPVAVFRFFAGDREYNPIVIVLRPFRYPQAFRYWQPFRDRKHGNLAALQKVESSLDACLHRNTSKGE
ncbi:hypothetical protein K227x_31240 [Rubripirellula lacrimiformis]|uniref:Uncharacterized protein n=1 Tax=Rubripirellula lacrimiformis TaxID=1930273 RepID=A0A517NC83_9BACT|nr:hypothetical protein [Rubripirellula lacrimiformis]QDT04729.1 hypothetical protein K227x_31240 [Rubripirellula lacrimiformis]